MVSKKESKQKFPLFFFGKIFNSSDFIFNDIIDELLKNNFNYLYSNLINEEEKFY